MASRRRQLRDDMNGLSDACLIIVQGWSACGWRVAGLRRTPPRLRPRASVEQRPS